MKRRSAIRIISLFAAALVCTAVWGSRQARAAEQADRTLRYQGEQAFS